MLIQNRQSQAFYSHGDAEVKARQREYKTEWMKLKDDLLSWKEHIPKDTVDDKKGGPCKFQVSNAWHKRGACQLKLIKTRIRNQIKNALLESLLHITINGPVHINKAVILWSAKL
ncbi:hypothetical protein OS493_012414 [Desmophyllum pertusum]|uniref:Uncharacterized protein n=1 Tax=Desmophyllum pertusum TaxID=174260 RepID=A0A9W9ZQH4_9CNID|nr:hypothetical protein OS493_012414 [Desmophyllum pertusum]